MNIWIKDFEILEALKQFGQTLLEIKQEKEEDSEDDQYPIS